MRHRRRRHRTSFDRGACVALAAALACAPAVEAAPLGTAFTYQGRLTDNGNPVTGTFDLRCAIFDLPSGGLPMASVVTFEDVPVLNGLFTIQPDFGTFVFVGAARYLEIGVRPGASTGAFTLLSGRQELKPAPSAVYSDSTPWQNIMDMPSGFQDGVDDDSGGDITGVTVGPGLTGGAASGAVSLGLDWAVVGANHSHFGHTWGGSGASGVIVTNLSGTALAGVSSASSGVSGTASATTGTSAGVLGSSHSTGGVGVRGLAPALAGPAVGVEGHSSSSAGTGVRGIVTALSGAPVGVEGTAVGTLGTGVRGIASAPAGPTVGVVGSSDSPAGIGVDGSASAGTGATVGVRGVTGSTAGRGVYGVSFATTGTPVGVLGETHSTSGRAIWGNSSGSGFAGYFSGNVNVVGTLSKSAGSFRIDHPLDPENRYLYHSFVESPDMMNVYNGNVTTDGDGFATVALPDWFEALNRDFRYQLTVVEEDDSAGFVQVKVARKIAANRFTIRTSAPGTEVSWQVTGVRRDAYAETHRIPVEEWKPEAERGRYLHPSDWNLPVDKGVDWDRRR